MGRPRHESPTLDAFAELLAQGIDPATAAARLGQSHPKAGNALLQRLRRHMGPQAV